MSQDCIIIYSSGKEHTYGGTNPISGAWQPQNIAENAYVMVYYFAKITSINTILFTYKIFKST